jgi:UDP-N-acetyl-D-glucosamine dehydrogenase
VAEIRIDGSALTALPETAVGDADCVVIITDHKAFDYPGLVKNSKLIVDTRNALRDVDSPKIQRL